MSEALAVEEFGAYAIEEYESVLIAAATAPDQREPRTQGGSLARCRACSLQSLRQSAAETFSVSPNSAVRIVARHAA